MNQGVNTSVSSIDYSLVNSKKYIYRIVKRTFDIFASLIGMIALIPLIIVVKISYMLTGDFNSIFFTQKRIGLNGKEFNFIKFRSMVPNADKILFEMLEKDEELREEYKINKKLSNDPRITKMGNILRKSSLDELPQVINAVHKKIPLTT